MFNVTEVMPLNETESDEGAAAGAPMLQTRIVASCMLGVFCVLGSVGNALAFLIYYRKREKGTSTIFILSLAVTDFFTCIIVIPYSMAYELLAYHLYHNTVCRLYHFVMTFNIPLSSLILVAIGFDRYFCICHPFLHAITVPRAKFIIFLLTLFSAAMGVIPALSYTVFRHEQHQINVSVPLSQVRDIDTVFYHDDQNQNEDTVTSDLLARVNGNLDLAASRPTDSDDDSTTTMYTDGMFLNPDKEFMDEYTRGQNGVSYKTATDDSVLGVTTSTATPTGIGISLDGVIPKDYEVDQGRFNGTSSGEETVLVLRNATREVYSALCLIHHKIIPLKWFSVYQKGYASIFLVIFIILAFLYALIYRSIFMRRAWKAKRRQKSGYSVANCHDAEETQLTNINGNATEANVSKKSQGRISSAMRDRTLYANIRTAAMLFVVTVVYVISFLPSWLMGLQVAPFNLIVFYVFYINNVINPFIYAFMNKSFRDDLLLLLKNCARRY